MAFFLVCVFSSCFISFIGGENALLSDFSNDTAPPQFREENIPTYFEVPVGEKVKLKCPVIGSPKPALEFFSLKGNISIKVPLLENEKLNRFGMIIENVSYANEGKYFCRAVNPYGFIIRNFTLKVIEKDIHNENKLKEVNTFFRPEEQFPPYFTQTSKMEIQFFARPAGSSIILKCPSSGKPLPRISWLKDGKALSLDINKRIHFRKWSMVIDHLISSDSGIYDCIVTNILGSINFTYELEVHERIPHKPIFRGGSPANLTVHVGERARFECFFISDLQPRFQWLRHYEINGSFTDSSDVPYVEPVYSTDPNITDPHVLILDNVTYEDEGWITCLAGNEIGISYRSAYLTVLPPLGEVIAEQKHKILDIQSTPLVVVIVVIISSIPLTIIGILIYLCRHKFKVNSKDSKQEIVFTKKIVVKHCEDEVNSIVPFVKIDYGVTKVVRGAILEEYDLPEDPAYEIPREKIKLGPLLGEGAFGKVCKATIEDINKPGFSTVVAIKMLKQDHIDSEMAVLVQEMELMKCIGKHVNVISLLGCCTKGGPLYVIVEYASKGCLKDYLRAHRPPPNYEVPKNVPVIYVNGVPMPAANDTPTANHSNISTAELNDGPIVDPNGFCAPNSIATEQNKELPLKTLLSFAYQSAKGLDYLRSKNCIHRDIAARNVLLTENDVIKIADFGLARDISNNEYYLKLTNGVLPIKWMSPEAIEKRKFSPKSDVWSYGVLLWEIFSLGLSPYPDIPLSQILLKLLQGHRMQKPDICPVSVYNLMLDCWNQIPSLRPSFENICNTLERILLGYLEETNQVYLDLEFPLVYTPENSASEDG